MISEGVYVVEPRNLESRMWVYPAAVTGFRSDSAILTNFKFSSLQSCYICHFCALEHHYHYLSVVWTIFLLLLYFYSVVRKSATLDYWS